MFSLEGQSKKLDQYRYQQFNIRYPQTHAIAPCLRPEIQLELIETPLYDKPLKHGIISLVNEALEQEAEVPSMRFASIANTQAEKLISMLRRTACNARNPSRDDDPALIRHVYDTFYIQQTNRAQLENVTPIVKKVIEQDILRYGNQHPEFKRQPIKELRFGLQLLEDTKFATRFQQYVVPMVYGEQRVDWQAAFSTFSTFVEQALSEIAEEFDS